MDIFAPKHGFVVELLVGQGDHVKIGKPLLRMDTDQEDRDRERLAKTERVRKEMAAQYAEPELGLSRRLAEISVELAKHVIETFPLDIQDTKDAITIGGRTSADLAKVESKYSQAILDLEKASIELHKFQYAVNRHLSINAIVKDYMDHEALSLDLIRSRLTLVGTGQRTRGFESRREQFF